jgi:uncharacterized LabA/DUF88 family protein
MIFIDGTNLFHRLDAARLCLNRPLAQVLTAYTGGRQIVRVYLYTIEQHLNTHRQYHGDNLTDGVRIVFGDGVPTGDGNIREKGVDALLVADIVYHAAVKNYDYALVVSTDTDFVQALRRVEDFGCRTGVLGVCSDVPDRLRNVCDETNTLPAEKMLTNGWARQRE